MSDAEARINEVADQIANEGMIERASQVRAGAVELSRQRHEIEKLRAQAAHAAGFLDGMAARIEGWVLWDSGEGDVESFNQAAADCRAMAASLQRLLKP